MKPAPVRSRSSLTSAAVISVAMLVAVPFVCSGGQALASVGGARPSCSSSAVRSRLGRQPQGSLRLGLRRPASVGLRRGSRLASARPRSASVGLSAAASVASAALAWPARPRRRSVASASPGRTASSSSARARSCRCRRQRPRPASRRWRSRHRSRRRPWRRLLGGARRALAHALDGGVGDQRAEQADGADGVVVGRDDVVDLVRVDVGVAGGDDRDLEATASVTAIFSRCGSTTKTAPGRRLILRTPPSFSCRRAISSVRREASFLDSRSRSPLVWRASSWSSRPTRLRMVTKLVSMPPSQRWLT